MTIKNEKKSKNNKFYSPKIIPLIVGIAAITISFLRVFDIQIWDPANSDAVMLFLFGSLLTLMWFLNDNQEKLISNFAEEEKMRDEKEKDRVIEREKQEIELQKKTYEMMERLTNAIVEVFPGSDVQKKYYEFRISTAEEKVEDLTWAKFDREGKLDASHPSYLEKIQSIADGGINYDEIFIFHNDQNSNNKNRLNKLKYHYDIAKRKKRTNKSRYSCSYIDTKELNFDFPRIQFTLVDSDEVIFTSSAGGNEKFKVKNKQLARLFKTYYDESWALSTTLIENGEIVDEKKILELLKPLKV